MCVCVCEHVKNTAIIYRTTVSVSTTALRAKLTASTNQTLNYLQKLTDPLVAGTSCWLNEMEVSVALLDTFQSILSSSTAAFSISVNYYRATCTGLLKTVQHNAALPYHIYNLRERSHNRSLITKTSYLNEHDFFIRIL